MSAKHVQPSDPLVSDPCAQADTPLPVLVISLPNSARRPIITDRLNQANIDFTFIDAIPGAALSDDIIASVTDPARSRRRMGRLLIRNEVGCALSHRKAYQHIIDSGYEAAIILEDDAKPLPALNTIHAEWRKIPAEIELLSLFKASGIILRKDDFQLGDTKLVRAASTIECTCGYFIRRATAIKMFEATTKISHVADWPIDLRQLRHYVTEPDVVWHDLTIPTEIGDQRPGFEPPPPPFMRKLRGLQALFFITYLRNRKNYDSLYNYYERELRVRLLARLTWRYKTLAGYTRRPDPPIRQSGLTTSPVTAETSTPAPIFEINSLWIGDKLPVIEQICALSMLRQGHKVNLYSFGKLQNVPAGIEIRDANDVLSKDRLLTYTKPDLRYPTLVSNVFRYRMLQMSLGIWMDMDMLVLKPVERTEHPVFGVEATNFINGAVLYLPADHPLLNELIQFTSTPFPIPPFYTALTRARLHARKWLNRPVHAGDLPWGIFGPTALTYFIDKLNMAHLAAPRSVFYPIDYNNAHGPLTAGWNVADHLTPDTIAIHLYSNILKQKSHLRPDQNSNITRIEPGSFIDVFAKTELGFKITQ